MLSLRRGLGLLILLVAGAIAILALPGPAHAADCDEQPLARTFLPWLDPSWYTPAPDGGLEAGGAGWTLDGGAAVVDGNEPWQVGGPSDARSLTLPAGSSAVTGPMCIGVAHPTLRFFARNAGSPLSTLAVAVEYRDLLGVRRSLTVGAIGAGEAWAPSPVLPVAVNLLSLVGGDQDVAFRFTPRDARGDWTIDDVFVDPYKKG